MTLSRLLDSSDGYIKGKSPDILETGGMGPCAGLAVYDPSSRRGVLGHFATPHESSSQNFAGMMRWIAAHLNPSNLEVT